MKRTATDGGIDGDCDCDSDDGRSSHESTSTSSTSTCPGQPPSATASHAASPAPSAMSPAASNVSPCMSRGALHDALAVSAVAPSGSSSRSQKWMRCGASHTVRTTASPKYAAASSRPPIASACSAGSAGVLNARLTTAVYRRLYSSVASRSGSATTYTA